MVENERVHLNSWASIRNWEFFMAAADPATVSSRGVLTFPFLGRGHCPVLEGERRYTVIKAQDGCTYVRVFLDQLDKQEFQTKSLEVANIAVGCFTLYFGSAYDNPKYLTDRVVPLPGEKDEPAITPLRVLPNLFTSPGK